MNPRRAAAERAALELLPLAAPVWTGRIVARAFVIERDVQTRALALAGPGVRFRALGEAILVVLPAPRTMHADEALGVPLVAGPGETWLATQLPAELVTALSPPAGAVLRLRAGRVVVERPGEELDPVAWLDVESLSIATVAALDAPPPPAEVVLAAPVSRPARAIFRRPPVSAEAEAARQAMASDEPAAPGLWARLAAWWRGRQIVERPARLPAPGTALARPRSPWRDRLDAWWRTLVARALWRSVLGPRHAAYVQHMLELFRQADLGEALRHAIPLGEGKNLHRAPALAPPKRRQELAISPQRAGGGPSIGVGDLLDDIRRTYRRAVQRLERDGHIDDAAFVLAELLGDDLGAVAFLERHGRKDLAAELAEARGLPPGLVVRQLVLAGRIDRAVAVARTHDAFADAVTRLADHPEEARGLRFLWADSLAGRGDFVGAAEVLRDEESGRALVREWLERAVEVGGPPAARALVRLADLAPERFAFVRDRVLAMAQDPAGTSFRASLALALVADEGDAERRRLLAHPILRGLLRDGEGAVPAGTLAALGARVGGALRADLPQVLPRAGKRTWPREQELGPEPGLAGLVDAVVLQSGRTLAAFGELGVRLVDARGQTLHHFDEPADKLVVARGGHEALAVVRRGGRYRVARLDLLSRRSRPWAELELRAFADVHDGAWWFVGQGSKVVALDLAAKEVESSWYVDLDIEGAAIHIELVGDQLKVIGSEDFSTSGEIWTWQLGRPPVLRGRQAWLTMPKGSIATALRPEALAVFYPEQQSAMGLILADARGKAAEEVPLPMPPQSPALARVADLVACAWTRPGGAELRLFAVGHQDVSEVRALHLPGAGELRLRASPFEPHELLVIDTSGRVLVLDVRSGAVASRVLRL